MTHRLYDRGQDAYPIGISVCMYMCGRQEMRLICDEMTERVPYISPLHPHLHQVRLFDTIARLIDELRW